MTPSDIADQIDLVLPDEGSIEALPGLRFFKLSETTEKIHSSSTPSFCMIARGSKTVTVGDQVLRYDPAHYLLASRALPTSSYVMEAPYLALKLELEPALVTTVLAETGGHESQSQSMAINVAPLNPDIVDAVARLVRLSANPDAAKVLAPLAKKEIVYWIAVSDQRQRLQQIASIGGKSARIGQAIDRLQRDFAEPLRVPEVAAELGMSVSAFHQHFKTVTGMSPLQFQKQLRLREARRLMLSEEFDAAGAGFQVGYDDPSYFSREYKSLFGQPPMRDIERMRGVSLAARSA